MLQAKPLGWERVFLPEMQPTPRRNLRKELQGVGVGLETARESPKQLDCFPKCSFSPTCCAVSRSEPDLGSGPAPTTCLL